MLSKFRLVPSSDPDVNEARRTDPRGAICDGCYKVNDYADDLGWWFYKNMGYVCSQCAPPHHGDR